MVADGAILRCTQAVPRHIADNISLGCLRLRLLKYPPPRLHRRAGIDEATNQRFYLASSTTGRGSTMVLYQPLALVRVPHTS